MQNLLEGYLLGKDLDPTEGWELNTQGNALTRAQPGQATYDAES
jgi:hypothetical protein